MAKAEYQWSAEMENSLNPPQVEQASYWREFFSTLKEDPLALAVWAGVFDDDEICSFEVKQGEALADAEKRHHRKLQAMLSALESLDSIHLQALTRSVRQQLKIE